MASAAGSGESFSMVRVFANLFRAIAANWAALLLFSLMLGLVSAAFEWLLALDLHERITQAAEIDLPMPSGVSDASDLNPPDNDRFATYKARTYWIALIGNQLTVSFATAGLIAGCFAYYNLERAELRNMLNVAFRKMIPVFCQSSFVIIAIFVALTAVTLFPAMVFAIVSDLHLLSVIFAMRDQAINSVMIVIGLVAALIALLLIAVAWWGVATQALIAEDIGIFASLRRSWNLTKGSRWRVVLAHVLFFTVFFGIAIALQGYWEYTKPDLWREYLGTDFAFNAGMSTVTAPLLASFMAALYQELRLVGEGDRAVGIVEVFS